MIRQGIKIDKKSGEVRYYDDVVAITIEKKGRSHRININELEDMEIYRLFGDGISKFEILKPPST